MPSVGMLTQPFASAAPNAALSWPNVAGTYINCNVGALAAMGTGAYTIVAMVKPPNGFVATLGLKVSTGYDRQIISDSGTWFGSGDFSGYGSVSVGDWQIIGQSKVANATAPAGNKVYHWYYWNYTQQSTPVDADGTGTHGDPGAITVVHLGDGDNRGNGPIAWLAAWKRVLSGAEFAGACTNNLASWRALAPDALWPLNVPAASVVDTTGNGANATGVVGGTITQVAGPPGYSF